MHQKWIKSILNLDYLGGNHCCSIEKTSFIQGVTVLPHINVQCPALYTFRKALLSVDRESHKKLTSVMSASKSEVPAKRRIGTLILPRFQVGG